MNGFNPFVILLDLSRRTRAAESVEELAFLAVNETNLLAPYRQAALWLAASGIEALSGVVQPEANAPYVHWLSRVARHLHRQNGGTRPLTAADLPEEEAAEWGEWLPEFGLWLPIADHEGQPDSGGGLLLAADHAWSEESIALLQEWVDAWRHAWYARQPALPRSWARLRQAIYTWVAPQPGVRWWKQRRIRVAAAILAVLFFPVHLTVLAPAELVPANPAVIRAPLDGVVGQFHVRPNEQVKAGQLLFGFDEAPIAARLEVAAQAQAAAEAEYRQFAQQAVSDNKSKAQLAILLGKVEEKRAEADYLRGQLERSRVVAPQDGIALFDDPAEWIGRPVQTGERIMRVASLGDVEVEAWIPLGDAIPLPEGADVSLYLAANPLSSIAANVRYVAHDSVPRPDGAYAYRLRARLAGSTKQRVGLKGTAKVYSHWVPFVYWMLRRPLATVRQTVGV
ncbi:HlyD family efflux transporter periplasmic adaptor subunit [Herbaspirillum sp. HC18]|nr:HlyD family efflux transporter periplasmic adaptor subunit [Herbaspirillum sp. HC18]